MHIKLKTKEKYEKRSSVRPFSKELFSLYPDGGLDSEGFSLSPLSLGIFGGGILLYALSAFLPMIAVLRTALSALGTALVLLPCIVSIYASVSRGRFFCEALPPVLSALVLFCFGYQSAAFFVSVLYVAAKFAGIWAARRQHALAESLLAILPEYASRIEGDGVVRIKPAHIRPDDAVFVKQGEIVPVDGVIERGMTSLDYTPLVHDTRVVPAGEGTRVQAGCINMTASIVVRAEGAYNRSTSARTFSAFRSCSEKKSIYAEYAEKIFNVLYPAFLILFVITALVIPVFSGKWAACAQKGAVLLLAACPFGLTDIISLSFFTASSTVFSNGAVISDGKVLEKLSKLEVFVCNKTGTVTEDTYTVSEIHPVEISEESFLSVASKAESLSVHPIAAAVRRYCGVTGDVSVENLTAEEIPGRGIVADIGGIEVLFGNASLLFDRGINCQVPERQGTAIHLAINGSYCGYIVLENLSRHGNYDALVQMRAAGVRTFALLSSDLRSVVRPVAAALNFDAVNSELTPEDKVSAVRYLSGTKSDGYKLAMAGNGASEKEASSAADVSFALSALGCEQECSFADVLVLGDGLSHVPAIVRSGRSCCRASSAVLYAGTGARVLLAILALAGVCPPVLAAAVFAFISCAGYLAASVFADRI